MDKPLSAPAARLAEVRAATCYRLPHLLINLVTLLGLVVCLLGFISAGAAFFGFGGLGVLEAMFSLLLGLCIVAARDFMRVIFDLADLQLQPPTPDATPAAAPSRPRISLPLTRQKADEAWQRAQRGD